METTIFQPGNCTFTVRRKSSDEDLQVTVKWNVQHDNEGCEDDLSVSIKIGDSLVGFAAYSHSTFINWTSSKYDIAGLSMILSLFSPVQSQYLAANIYSQPFYMV